MGNTIADIGKMKSLVERRNRLSTVVIKKMARLGTEKHPAVVHVRTEARLKEVAARFKEKGWQCKIALEPDKPEDVADLERLLNPLKPQTIAKKLGRNEPCSCASGKKYKNCCGR